MIAKISRGGRFGGLMVYLAGPGREGSDVHEDPHLVAGDPWVYAMHGDGQLDRDDALAVGRALNRARQNSGVKVTAPVRRWDAQAEAMMPAGRGDAHVWHCSLSLHRDEGTLSDETWSKISHDFMARMGFDDPADPRIPAQWVAVRHGVSATGNDHVHLVASVVRPDGTKVNLANDYKRASQAVAQIERDYGLRVVEGRSPEFTSNERAYSQAEDLHQRAQRGRAGEPGQRLRDPDRLDRHDVHRRVRAAVEASSDEAEFVRRLRDANLAVRPFFAKGTHEVVTGYSVALRNAEGKPQGMWCAGGKIARDLSLPALRKSGRWPDTPESASEAAAEWRSAKRGLRPANTGGRETRAPSEQDWRDWYARTDELLADLAAGDTNPHVWARAAREASGALSAWSVRAENGPGGELGNAARALSRSAWMAQQDTPSAPLTSSMTSGVGAAAMLMATAGTTKGKRARLDALLLAQIMRLSQAVHGVHVAAGRSGEASRVEAAVRHDLARARGSVPRITTIEVYERAEKTARIGGDVSRDDLDRLLARHARGQRATAAADEQAQAQQRQQGHNQGRSRGR